MKGGAKPDISEIENLVRQYGACIAQFSPSESLEILEGLNALALAARENLLDAVRAIVAERNHAVDCADAYKAEADYLREVAKQGVKKEVSVSVDAKPISDCKKCGGAGWVRGCELDDADEATISDTMTRYSCDSCEVESPKIALELKGKAYDLLARQQPFGEEVSRILAQNMSSLYEGAEAVSEAQDTALASALRSSVKIIAKGVPVSDAQMPTEIALLISQYRLSMDVANSEFLTEKGRFQAKIKFKDTERGVIAALENREKEVFINGVVSGAKQMFDALQYAAANTSDTEWDERLCDYAETALESVSPESHREWKTIQRVSQESYARGRRDCEKGL